MLRDAPCGTGVVAHMTDTGSTPLRDHLRDCKRLGLSPRTIDDRRLVLLRVEAALSKPLLACDEDDLDAWQAALKVSVSSVQTYTSHVRAFYRWTVDTRRLPDSPAARLMLPKVPKRQPRPIPEKDLKVAIEVAAEPLRTWLILSAYAGLRAGEISRIRREDVVEVEGRTILHVDGKGRQPRPVPLSPQVADALRPHLVGAQGVVFRRGGVPWRPSYISREVSKFFTHMQMPYKLHQGRHRFGTEGYRTSRDVLQLGRLMGHASPGTTMLYVALSDEGARKTVDRLGKGLGKSAA